MLTLTDVKTALRIDSDVDNVLLNRYMQSAESYMRGAIDDYDELRAESAETEQNSFNAKADIVELAIVTELYEHRVSSDKSSDKQAPFTPIIGRMLTQLQYTARKVSKDG